MNTDKKELVSAYTHLAGAVLAVIGFILMIIKALNIGKLEVEISILVFGLSLILLYLMSTTYHMVDPSYIKEKKILRKLDHIMIFVLIAGTYTPICLINLKDMLIGNVLLIVVWAVALIGLFIKLFWINAPRWIATSLYILMGWTVIFVIKPVVANLNGGAIFWLLCGGISYTLGGIIYGLKKPNLTFKNFGFHELFHIFILLGSACHFIMVYFYII